MNVYNDTVDSGDAPRVHNIRRQAARPGNALSDTLASASPSVGLQGGDSLSRYRILEKIGQGGMGIVYSAYDPQLDRRIALKLVLGATPDHTSTQRLLREAQALARLSHPNVVSVHDAAVADAHLFIAMEFIEGQTLGEWRENDRTLEERLAVLTSAGRGLAAAHTAGLLHRDFKPDNVMVGDDGRVRVMDFGLARDTKPPPQEERTYRRSALSISLTQTGSMMGTPAYMSPEQFTGACDPRSDQYSFFVVVYETLFGHLPFDAETLEELIEQVSSTKTLVIPADDTVPLALRRVIARGLSTDPEQRFDDMTAALTGLSLDHERRRTWALPAGVSFLAALTGLTAWLSLTKPEDLCASAALAAQRSWDDQARESIRTSFKATEAPFAIKMAEQTVAALDVVGRSHAQNRREVCEATRVEMTQSETLLDLRMRCLDSHRRRFESLISALSATTVDTAAEALYAIDTLPTAADCQHTQLNEQHPPPAIELRAEVERLQQVIARAYAESTTGANIRALRLLESEAQAVEAVDYRPLYVEFYAELGALQRVTLTAGAEATLVQALSHSVTLGDDESSLKSLSALVLTAAGSDKPGEADHWLALFRSFMTRRGDRLSDQVQLERLLAHMAIARGDREASVRHIERALAVQQELDPTNSLRLALLHKKAGLYYLNAEALDRAEHHYAQAHKLNLVRFGAEHPAAALTLGGLATVAGRRGDHEKALLLHEQALNTFERAYGDESELLPAVYVNFAVTLTHAGQLDRSGQFFQKALERTEGNPEMAKFYHDTLANYGVSMWFGGRYEEALALQEESLRLQKSSPSVHPLDLGIAEGNLASTLASLGRNEESLQLHRSALARFESRLSRDDPTIAVALFDMVTPMIALGLLDEALSQLERAESIHVGRTDDPDPYVLAEVRVVMVEILRPSTVPSNRKRSKSLAVKVHAAVADLGPRGDALVRRLDAAGVRSRPPLADE